MCMVRQYVWRKWLDILRKVLWFFQSYVARQRCCRKKGTRVHRIRPYCDRQMREKSILFSTQRKQRWDEIVVKTTHNSLYFTNSRKRWRCGDEVQHFSTRAQTQACVRWWVEWEYLSSTSCPLLLMEEEKTTRLCAYLKSSRLFSDVDAPLSYSSSSRLVVYPDCCYSWLPHISPCENFSLLFFNAA